ncbi:unnamed protein product [Sphagnum balticum]
MLCKRCFRGSECRECCPRRRRPRRGFVSFSCVQERGEFDTNVCHDGASCGSSVLVSSPSCSWIDSLSMEPTFVSSRHGKGMY